MISFPFPHFLESCFVHSTLATQLGLAPDQVRRTLALLDEGNTVPFLARYRKEQTGNLDEVQIREVGAAARRLRQLEDRRAAILASVAEQGALTPELQRALEAADELSRLEDLYAPHRPRRRTRGQRAREAGLDPVARAMAAGKQAHDIRALALPLRSSEYETLDAVLAGARDILAEEVAEDAGAREFVRSRTRKEGRLVSRPRRGGVEDPTFRAYLDFAAPLDRVRPHQTLALRRGEAARVLSVGVEVPGDALVTGLRQGRTRGVPAGAGRDHLDEAVADGYVRLLAPAVERELRGELEARADAHAIEVFALNLRNLLLQPPLAGARVLGIDPGLRTGCKLAAVDAGGRLLETGQIFVHDRRREAAPAEIRGWVERHRITLVAIGNGTGGRETEAVVAEAIRGLDGVHFALVDEAGASVYSASDLAREEFPELDVSLRGAVSIARRIQDPLSELVKIDPRSIGVGMYQHDVNQGALAAALDAVVEDAVNAVGVEANTASAPLLARVAGVGPTLARRIVEHREASGSFRTRKELMAVKGLGAKTFEQCAGFLRIREGREPLDATGIHPEQYPLAQALLAAARAGVGDAKLGSALETLESRGELARLADRHGAGPHTLADVLDALVRPGRDPREALTPPVLRRDVLTLDDLKVGATLPGTVRNVVDFGAFVDIGVKQDGLIHVSRMGGRWVKNPHEVMAVGDVVQVTVDQVDRERGRIALSLVLAPAS